MIYNSVELRSVYVDFNFGITSIGIWETVYRVIEYVITHSMEQETGL